MVLRVRPSFYRRPLKTLTIISPDLTEIGHIPVNKRSTRGTLPDQSGDLVLNSAT